MNITNDVNPPMEEFVKHSGVKGMRWGVRKKNVTSSEIHGARNRQNVRLRELSRQSDIVDTSTGKARSSATSKAKKLARDFQTNEDRVTAARLTTGEKVASLILTGPIGAVLIGVNSVQVRNIARETDALRQQIK